MVAPGFPVGPRRRGRDQALIDRFVLVGHPGRGEPVDDRRADGGPIETGDPIDQEGHLGHIVAKESVVPDPDDLGECASRSGDQRRPAGERFDRHEAEGLRP